MPKDSQALSLLTAKSAAVHFSQDAARQRLLDTLAAIARHEAQATKFALQIGVILWQAKAALPHGQFQPWIKENIAGKSYRSCAYYMKLTMAFVETARPGAALLECLSGIDFEKDTGFDYNEHATLAAIAKFTGDLSLTELLIKHGIKGVGLKGELTEGETPPALSPAEQQQQELALIWSQAYQPAKSLADLIAERAQGFTADQREALQAELSRALDALRRA